MSKIPLTNERCKTCAYSHYVGSLSTNAPSSQNYACIYCLRVGQLRGCPAGKHCTKYKPKGEI